MCNPSCHRLGSSLLQVLRMLCTYGLMNMHKHRLQRCNPLPLHCARLITKADSRSSPLWKLGVSYLQMKYSATQNNPYYNPLMCNCYLNGFSGCSKTMRAELHPCWVFIPGAEELQFRHVSLKFA